MIESFSNYKRVFAFGCSFTSWIYPTYADLIFKSCPNAEKYNFGKSGGGNVFIANRLTEANKKFNFNKDDLIVLMWSTFARLDVWKMHDRWITPGNIYSQAMISEQVVKEIVDLDGMLIRDLSIIDLTTNYLNNLPCDVIKFMSVPADYDHVANHYQEEVTTSIIKTYNDTIKSYKVSYYDFLNKKWPAPPTCYEYKETWCDHVTDYHPLITQSIQFLNFYNVPITDEAKEYGIMAHEFMSVKDNKHVEEIYKKFPECSQRKDESYKHLW